MIPQTAASTIVERRTAKPTIMTTFTLTPSILEHLFEVNQFALPAGADLVFVGIRGCLPQNIADNGFAGRQTLVLRGIDYINLRCTLLQWKRSNATIAVFAGSTVPSMANIKAFKTNPAARCNCLTPGFYRHYVKGQHRPKNPRNWYDAWRQNEQPLAIRRTTDNFYYDNFDPVEVSTGCDDNIHAGWTLDTDSNYFSSAGCQVIMGIPFCESTQATQQDNRGPWKVFKDNGYAAAQSEFPYALFTSADVYKVSSGAGSKMPVRLKFGSSGPLVTQVQTTLVSINYLDGEPDGQFGPATFDAVKRFQTDNFGEGATDCIVGPVTSQVLRISFPSVSL
jgi:hypothetical protein